MNIHYLSFTRLSKLAAALLFVFVTSGPLSAQDGVRYQKPPQSILDIIDAPTTPTVSFTRSGKIALMYDRPDFPTISDVSQPVVGLAGLRLNPANNSSAVASNSTGITVRDLTTGVDNKIQGLPAEVRIGNTSLNADETLLAFTHSGVNGVELWIADMTTFQARRLVQPLLNDAYGNTLSWAPDGKRLLVSFIPDGRGPMPKENPVPSGPVVQENLGKAAPNRTYQNLLKNEYDETLFDYFVTSQLAYVDLDGKITKIGKPGIYRSASFSPDGNFLLVQTVVRPYSYLVPVQNFPYHVSIWDAAGKEVKHIYHYKLSEAANLSRDNVSPEPRSYSWRPDQPSTLTYVQALDGGDSKKEVEFRDGVYQLKAPFTGEAQVWLKTKNRFGGIQFIDEELGFVSERNSKDRTTIMNLVNLKTGAIVKTVSERKNNDIYTDPGRFVTTTNQYNRGVVLKDAKSKQLTVFTISGGQSPDGDRPFLMKWNIITGKQDTLFKSQAPYYESVVFFNNSGNAIISRESVNDAPNYFLVNLKNRQAKAITNFPNPYPFLAGVSKEIVSYKRSDGLTLNGTLYLPAGYDKEKDGPLPMLLWAYPREFDTAEAAAQKSGSPYRFTRIGWGSAVFWVTRGYAVLDNADMPIVGGDGKEPNDTFVEQLEDNSRAAINFLADQGIVDPKRVGVGGHSYGAFMTANLLAHTDLFAAGLARSGAYNRTFTPFGFQNERRTYWENTELYTRMSPFTYANKIKTPILLIHGMDDENSGTFPIQSERLYNAIKGHGGTARLVFLPKEFHSYRAKESILHTLWEMDQWLETYVKNRKVD